MTLGLNSDFEVVEFSSLTSLGVTPSVATAGVNLLFQVTASGIGTNVQIRLEASLDNVNFFNLKDDDQDITISADGTTGYPLSGCPAKFVRVRLVSISGGSPTIASKVGAA